MLELGFVVCLNEQHDDHVELSGKQIKVRLYIIRDTAIVE